VSENSITWEELAEGEKVFLDMIERKAFEFFWNEVNPSTGLISDSPRASIATVGWVGEPRGCL